jgi:hypothetical protein
MRTATARIAAVMALLAALLLAASACAAQFQVLVGYGEAGGTAFTNPQPASASTTSTQATHFAHFDWGAGGSGPDGLLFGSGGLQFAAGVAIDGNFDEPFSLGTLVFTTSTTAGGEAGSVDLRIVLTLLQPSGAAAPVVVTLPLTIVTVPEIIAGTQYGRGRSIGLPATFPGAAFDVGDTSYQLRLIGFGSQAAGAITTISSLDMPADEVVVSADLYAVLQGCGGSSARQPPIAEGIGGFGQCGAEQVGVPMHPTWGRFGSKRVLEFDSGEKLEMVCAPFGGLIPGTEQLFYTRPGSSIARMIGVAPFEGSCSFAGFEHSGDENHNCKPDRLVSTWWMSYDYGANDVPNAWTRRGEFLDPPTLDIAQMAYDAATNQFNKVSMKYLYPGAIYYGPEPPQRFTVPKSWCAQGKRADTYTDSALYSFERLDPPLGPETDAFFADVLAHLAQVPFNGAPMEEGVAKLCDLDGNGSCDPADADILSRSLGACVGDAAYDPRVDINASGCVDLADRRALFIEPMRVVEFYNAALDHYFISAHAAEIAALDAGTQIKGWVRTGLAFSAYPPREPDASTVCRFYIPPQLGDSHFFGRGADECATTASNHPEFTYESAEVIDMKLPAAGACPADTVPVYRVFSNRADANHRYTTSRQVRDEMVAKGWLAEGDGPDAVVMCAPQ